MLAAAAAVDECNACFHRLLLLCRFFATFNLRGVRVGWSVSVSTDGVLARH